MRAFIACLLLFAVTASACRSQERDQPVSASLDLTGLAQEEAKRGVYLFYTQTFIDKDNKRATYRGSIYGAIQRFELKGCDLKIEAIIVDKFSGTIGKAPTGPLQDTYRYSAVLTLTLQ